jgi:hypothetical protein
VIDRSALQIDARWYLLHKKKRLLDGCLGEGLHIATGSLFALCATCCGADGQQGHEDADRASSRTQQWITSYCSAPLFSSLINWCWTLPHTSLFPLIWHPSFTSSAILLVAQSRHLALLFYGPSRKFPFSNCSVIFLRILDSNSWQYSYRIAWWLYNVSGQHSFVDT